MIAVLSAVVSFLSFAVVAALRWNWNSSSPFGTGGRPAAPAPGPSEAFPRRPCSLGVALPDLGAGPAHHGAGQAGNRDPVASQRLSALLAAAVTPSGTAQDEPRDP